MNYTLDVVNKTYLLFTTIIDVDEKNKLIFDNIVFSTSTHVSCVIDATLQ